MWRIFRDLWWLALPARKRMVLGICNNLVIQSLALGLAYSLSLLLDTINADLPHEQFMEKMLWIFGGLVFLVLSERCMRSLNDFLTVSIIFNMYREVSLVAHRQMMRLSLNYHESESSGHKRKKVERGITKTVELIDAWGFGGLPIICLMIASLTILYIKVSWVVGIAMTLLIPTFLYIAERFHRRSRIWRHKRHDLEEDAESHALQTILNVSTVQAFHRQAHEAARLDSLWKELVGVGMKGMRIIIFGGMVRGLIASTFILAALVHIAYLGRVKAITLGEILLAGYMMDRIGSHLWALGNVLDRTMRDSDSIHRLRDMLELTPDIQERENATALHRVTNSITFENVTFTYPTRNEPALKNISATLPVGKVIALVGPSGSGKTTFAKLLMRFLDPQEGSIRIDGHDLRDLQLSFRRIFGLVAQNPGIFDETLWDNVAYGCEGDVLDERIHGAVRAARVSEFASELPNQLQTMVGEKGAKLSGGQQQRVAIARAVAMNCPVLVLDEATSHLDVWSERCIQEALREVATGRTAVIIAHRLSTVRDADEILVFDKGEIVQRGDHESLSQQSDGLYWQLLQLHHGGILANRLPPQKAPAQCMV